MSDEQLASWWTKQEAADRLQTSVRSIERRISAGELEARKRRRSGPKAQYETVVNPADVAKLMPAAHVMPTTEQLQAPVRPPAEVSIASTDFYEFFQGILTTLATGATASRQLPDPEKNWLTLEEAEARSGLSAGLLKQLCKTGKLPAIRDGRAWKIHRKNLDAFEGE